MLLKSTRRLNRSAPSRLRRLRRNGARKHVHVKHKHIKPLSSSKNDEPARSIPTKPMVVPRASQSALTGHVYTLSIGSYEYPLSVVYRRAAQKYSQISIDPERKAGAPCIVGTRIPVYMVLDALEEHGSIDGVRKSYPGLTVEQIRDAIGFARFVLECPIDEIALVA
jgi:uncharacterized protein (DUF433 family)